MATRFTTDFPSPKDDDEFEDMLRDICAYEWGDSGTERFGRSGQKQYGVDVYGKPQNLNGNYYATQCKLRVGGKQLTRKVIEKEVKEAKSFPLGTLKRLIIATSAPRDTKVQEIIAKISEQEEAQGGFEVTGLFWQDITHRLASHPRLCLKYYRDFFSAVTNINFPERLIDIPITVSVSIYSDVDNKAPIVQALKILGTNTTNERGISTVSGAEIHSDGYVFLLPQQSSQDEKLWKKFAADVFSCAKRIEDNCPIFAILPVSFHSRFLDEFESFGLASKRVVLMKSENSVGGNASAIFHMVFDYGYERRGKPRSFNVVARTMMYTPDSAMLDLDWLEYFASNSFPSNEAWETILKPALQNLAIELGQVRNGTRIQIDSRVFVPVAMALGFYLSMRSFELGVWVRTADVSDFKYQFWRSTGEQSNIHFSETWFEKSTNDNKSAIVELTTSMSIHSPVTDFVRQNDIQADSWLCIQPPDGYDMRYIKEEDAIAYAEQVGNVIRRLNSTGVVDIHLFLRIPSALGVLIGQRLQACGRLHIYWFKNPSYDYGFTLS